jgi:hypothetical protein
MQSSSSWGIFFEVNTGGDSMGTAVSAVTNMTKQVPTQADRIPA